MNDRFDMADRNQHGMADGFTRVTRLSWSELGMDNGRRHDQLRHDRLRHDDLDTVELRHDRRRHDDSDMEWVRHG